MKRYRYIMSGIALGDGKIGNFRLIAGNNIKPSYNGEVALRVNIPEDLKMNKYSCDSYSTTDDQRTLDELGYDVLIWHKKAKKWRVHNNYKGTKPCDIHHLSPYYM
ncbi:MULTISPECIES: hypothetical protein [unclassified Psychrobacillus]|uniref:hypothetical protein n=1 Tax=unclassified Psychrobacillus TaxID=2636677 RepID=UPI0030FC6D1D